MKHSFALLTAVALGFCLSRIGFSSWDEVHAMFTLRDLRLVFTFLLAVVVLGAAWLVVRRVRPNDPPFSARPIHRGTVVGGVLFGVGWALSGACPGIILVQVGEGKLGALVTLAGVFLGNALYAAVHQRYFRFSVGSCEG